MAGNNVSRRSFLKYAAVLGGASAVAGLTGCSPDVSGDTTGAAGESGSSGPSIDISREVVEGVSVVEHEPIDISGIEAIEADVLVIGAGVSGSFAAATAAEKGKKVVIFQKGDAPFANGAGAAIYHSKLALSALDEAVANGVGTREELDWDPWAVLMECARGANENRQHMDLLKLWIYNSGPVMDWAYDLTNDVEGLGPVTGPYPFFGTENTDDWTVAYPCIHMWSTGTMKPLVDWMVAYAQENGAELYCSTPAVQLLTDESGAVIGAVGKGDNGEYVVCKAGSTILAAGSYGSNPEMRALYLPHASGLPSCYGTGDDTGDGLLMAMDVGGQIQRGPHASNIHYDPPVGCPDIAGSGFPWLRVNELGERFSNEDVAYDQIYAADMNQPGLRHFDIFDDNFRTDSPKMGSGMGRNLMGPTDMATAIDTAVADGLAYASDTIEGLAELVGIPADTLAATVARYNKIVERGQDVDFGKQKKYLTAVVKAPFYAVERRSSVLCSLSGMLTNDRCQALDENNEVIEGLYCVGNCQGYYFGGLVQDMRLCGMTLGRAMTTGRCAALYACGCEDEVLTDDLE